MTNSYKIGDMLMLLDELYHDICIIVEFIDQLERYSLYWFRTGRITRHWREDEFERHFKRL